MNSLKNSQDLKDAALKGLDALCKVVVGKDIQVRRAVAVLLSGGHLLLEDLPGVGKTTLAKGLSRIMGGNFQRIQGTNDLLPSDLLGIHLWDGDNKNFQFHPGPIFANVLLLDELNRMGPKTQSALLEAMTESQVSLDRSSYTLPQPFFVIATQNPMDHAGTFPLPESQLDRFASVIHLGYPPQHSERQVLMGLAGAEKLDTLYPALNLVEWQQAMQDVRSVEIKEPVFEYLEAIIKKLRQDGAFCSTRAVSHWMGIAKAEAWLQGRSFVTPDDLQLTLGDAMAHRGHMDDRRMNRDERREQLKAVLKDTPVGWK